MKRVQNVIVSAVVTAAAVVGCDGLIREEPPKPEAQGEAKVDHRKEDREAADRVTRQLVADQHGARVHYDTLMRTYVAHDWFVVTTVPTDGGSRACHVIPGGRVINPQHNADGVIAKYGKAYRNKPSECNDRITLFFRRDQFQKIATKHWTFSGLKPIGTSFYKMDDVPDIHGEAPEGASESGAGTGEVKP